MLEKWVGEQGGGLIVMAGPVDACKGPDSWVQDPDMNLIRNLYPVEFFGRHGVDRKQHVFEPRAVAAGLHARGHGGRLPLAGRFGDRQQQGLGVVARRVQLSVRCAVRSRVRPSTRDSPIPRVAQGGEGPVYFAGQFYGAGSVFYMGSAEMWRLRAVDDTYFSQFYTKLIRHVSQGRLLRGSTRGVLLVGQDRYLLGNTVEVRAQLTNARLEPLDMPSVNLQVIQPDGATQTVALRADPSRVGAYRRAISGPSGRHLPHGIAGARKRERTAQPPHPSEGARPGTREPAAKRRRTQRDREEYGRKVLRGDQLRPLRRTERPLWWRN